MCGIAGIFSPQNQSGKYSIVKDMLNHLEHRGPDGEGVWHNRESTCWLGHKRLSIIDLTEGGFQPIISNCGRYSLTFNGEIYNYIEIRKELERQGYLFRSDSDTEVLLQSFCASGIVETLQSSIGMFAGALWDNEERLLYLFRDRAGKKPLYYTNQGDALWFASEINAFKNNKNVSLTLDLEAINHYLSLGYIPSPSTVYQEVLEVGAGSVIKVASDLSETFMAFWEFKIERDRRISRFEAVEEIEALLQESVSLRLRSDVPVGVFLSGGIDSGLITALAAMQSSRSLKTFSAIFPGSSFDESESARQVAERYGTEHHELVIPSRLDDLIIRVGKSYGEPIADPSIIPTFAIAEEASKYIKVVLNGEGSDELFGGYRRHQAVMYFEKLSLIFNTIPKKVWQKLGQTLPKPIKARTPYGRFVRFARGLGLGSIERYLLWGADGFDENEKRSLWKQFEFQSTNEFLLRRYNSISGLGVTSNFMALDFLSGMADCLLPKVDMATMASSIEGRSPFLDHRIIEWSNSINEKDLLHGQKSKPILRALAAKHLPTNIVNAPKRGFEIPLFDWVDGPLKQLIGDFCLSNTGLVAEVFNQTYVSALFDGRLNIDSERRAKCLWTLLMLAVWDNNNK